MRRIFKQGAPDEITGEITTDDLISVGYFIVISALALAELAYPVPISDSWLAALLILGLAANFAMKVKIINEVNPHLAPNERWKYLQYMTVFHSQRLNEQHRRFHGPKGFSWLSWLSWITYSATLLMAVEAIDRWVVHR